jgi:hypothetical protein
MYARVDSFTFVPSGNFGSSSYRIPSANIYYNNSLLGTHLLPATVPIMGEPGGVLTAIPGIDYSGLGGYQISYPFYRPDTVRFNGIRGQVTPVPLKTTYFEATQVRYSQDFEGTAGFTPAGSDVNLTRTTDPGKVFEGTASGSIFIDGSKSYAQVASLASFQLSPGRPAYLEMNFKGDVILEVMMLTQLKNGELFSGPIISLFPRTDWRKVYIGLQDFVGEHQGTSYNILLKAVRPGGQASAEVLIDNLKVLTF